MKTLGMLTGGMAALGLMASSVSAAGIYDDNSGYDRFFTGPWSSPQGSFRDNIAANGDNWLGANMGHFVKEAYGPATGSAAAPGFVGHYRGAAGDVNSWTDYTFVAGDAIAAQDWVIKGTVNAVLNRAAQLTFQVSVNGSPFSDVDQSSIFGNGSTAYDIDMGAPTGDIFQDFYAYDGPEESRVADLSSLGIQAGDNVVYRFRWINNSPAGSQSANLGLGVALIPEPASLALLALGGLALIRRR